VILTQSTHAISPLPHQQQQHHLQCDEYIDAPKSVCFVSKKRKELEVFLSK
jgi:hypothetical protein